jgi:hypothetical protein
MPVHLRCRRRGLPVGGGHGPASTMKTRRRLLCNEHAKRNLRQYRDVRADGATGGENCLGVRKGGLTADAATGRRQRGAKCRICLHCPGRMVHTASTSGNRHIVRLSKQAVRRQTAFALPTSELCAIAPACRHYPCDPVIRILHSCAQPDYNSGATLACASMMRTRLSIEFAIRRGRWTRLCVECSFYSYTCRGFSPAAKQLYIQNEGLSEIFRETA